MAGKGVQQKQVSMPSNAGYRTYTSDDAPGIPIGPKAVMALSFGLLGGVIVLHIISRLIH